MQKQREKALTIKPEPKQQGMRVALAATRKPYNHYNMIFYQWQENGGNCTAYIKKTNNPNMGRPTKNPLSHDLRIRLDSDTNSLLEQYCKDESKSKSEAVRAILQNYFKNSKF